ncbi:hypothetical protein vseg_003847 [Gypsophila vaccaria]
MNSTNYMTNYMSLASESEDSNQQSSWDLYDDDFIAFNNNNNKTNYGMESSSMVSNLIDEDLEDTASSPVHSPKVNDFSGLFMMSQKLDTIEFSQEKVQNFQKNEEIMNRLLETELRRRGLCLVPVSMVVNCLGSN